MASAHIETRRINARNMTRQFAAVYGAGHLNERMLAANGRRALHVRGHRIFTLPFIRGAWGTLNYRWVQEIREITNQIRMYSKVERPTFDQRKAIGMAINPVGGHTIFRQPDTFNIKEAGWYFQTEIVRK